MNNEKYESIKNKYCVKVTGINLNAMTNETPMLISGESLTYNDNNGVVSFIDEYGNSYVSPYYEIANTLKQAGYTKGGLYVPYTDNKWLNEGALSTQWTILLNDSRKIETKI